MAGCISHHVYEDKVTLCYADTGGKCLLRPWSDMKTPDSALRAIFDKSFFRYSPVRGIAVEEDMDLGLNTSASPRTPPSCSPSGWSP